MSSLSDNTQEVLKEIFDLYKNANDGKFCRDQVANAVRAAGLVPTNEEVSRVLGIADDQNSNPISVTFEELCSIYEQLAQNCAGSYEELVDCLKVFDKDSKGKISAVELKQLLTALGEKLPIEMVDELLNELQDNNADVDIFALCDRIAPSSITPHNAH
uniref:EF-hand domain-containing protein n=1 Tax=Acrobeloides nanus TaxID=290746 RepID=A0A914DZW0_9BILA